MDHQSKVKMIYDSKFTKQQSDQVKTQVVKVASLYEGDFFGEMSLLTGEPRCASVSSLTVKSTTNAQNTPGINLMNIV